jgi:hypothetical protein
MTQAVTRARATTRSSALLGLALAAAGLSACATTTSTSFKGEQHAVAQTVEKLQSSASAGEAGTICNQLLARKIVTSLQASPGGCKQAIKTQLNEIDSFELTVQSVQLGPAGAAQTATAGVKSVYKGKKRASTLTLVKEGGAWKISGLG